MRQLAEYEKAGYLSRRFNRCPYCDNNDLEFGAIVANGRTASNDVTCRTCEAKWVDQWTRTGISEEIEATCDDCGWVGGRSEVTWPPKDLADRLDPGGVVPAGDCPDCGAFTYLAVAR